MAAKLILSMDGAVIKEYPLTKERTTIGRKAYNDIVIDNLAVSGEHAAVVTIMNDSFLEDLDSTNGLEVNGTPTKKHFLQNNDLIEIGKYKLKYINDQVSQTNPADFEKTVVLRSSTKQAAQAPEKLGETASFTKDQIVQAKPGDRENNVEITGKLKAYKPEVSSAPAQAAASTPAPSAPASTPAPSAPAAVPVVPAVSSKSAAPTPGAQSANQKSAVVQLLTGPNAGKELELVKNLTTLGKPGVQVAVLTRRPQGFFITHVEGDKFPMVNGQILGSQAQQLNDHDVIELAGVKMEFYFKG